MSSKTVCSFWEEHASATAPAMCGTQKPRTASALLGDDLPRSRLQLLVQPLRPFAGGVLHARVLRADLGDDGEVAREVGDQLELACARDLDRPVRDLDVRQAELAQPLLVLVES